MNVTQNPVIKMPRVTIRLVRIAANVTKDLLGTAQIVQVSNMQSATTPVGEKSPFTLLFQILMNVSQNPVIKMQRVKIRLARIAANVTKDLLAMDSGFLALDSGFLALDSGFLAMVPDS